MSQIVIGMAGHIDHGKTSLIKSLTGQKTERYSEEVERGLTIDIGFAFLNDKITLIDVPGHEKFIKNMLTGSYGIDFAILVIAADDGIMPQTKEHFEILKLLGVKQGLIVLNKIDLVEQDWIDLLIEDIKGMTEKSFLENSSIIKTSTTNNIGIEELRESIIKYSQSIPGKYDRGFFRLAIDRAFTIKGHGTVVTGTVTSGEICTGSMVDVMPNNQKYKIRGMHSHEKIVDKVGIGSRAAININNLDIDDIYRGYQICSPGYLAMAKKLIVSCTLLDNLKKPLKQNQRVRIHIGTSEVIGRVSLVDIDNLEPGETDNILIKLESEVIAAMDDKFILRTFSPIITIGGGEVIDRMSELSWKEAKKFIRNINGMSKDQIKYYMIEHLGFNPLTYKNIQMKFGLGDNQINQFINSNQGLCLIEYKSQKWVVSNEQLKSCSNKLLDFLKSNSDDYDIGFSKSLISQHTSGNEKFLDFLLDKLEKTNDIYKKNEKWIVKGEVIILNESDENLKDNLLNIIENEYFTTSSLEELSEKTNCEQQKLKKILNILEKDHQIIRLNENLIFSNKNIIKLKENLNKFFVSNELLSMQDFKEISDTTRKYSVPLLEYFDKINFTFRVNNGRKLIK